MRNVKRLQFNMRKLSSWPCIQPTPSSCVLGGRGNRWLRTLRYREGRPWLLNIIRLATRHYPCTVKGRRHRLRGGRDVASVTGRPCSRIRLVLIGLHRYVNVPNLCPRFKGCRTGLLLRLGICRGISVAGSCRVSCVRLACRACHHCP